MKGGIVTDHPHLDVFRRTYAAFTTGDTDALAEVFAEEVVWHTPGRNPLSGDHQGRDATFASFAREFELSGGTYAVEVHDVVANDDHTVALLRSAAQRDGKSLEMNYVLVLHQRREDHRGLGALDRSSSARRVLDVILPLRFAANSCPGRQRWPSLSEIAARTLGGDVLGGLIHEYEYAA
jgi:ketosteroid isomerase-like protein